MQRQTAGQLGGLRTDLAQSLAGNRVNTASAQNQAVTQGIGNFLKLADTAVKTAPLFA